MLKITVPASSANLGAGFDALGLALTLHNRVWMEEADGCHIESLDDTAIPTDESNMIYHTARLLFERCGHPFHGLHIRQENNIPLTRGLGSSSACLVAGLLGANTLLGSPRTLVCQSCGMPLNDDILAKNTDGSFNEQYCMWCWDGEGFAQDCTMEEMVEHCLPHMPLGRTDPEACRAYMRSLLPTLGRWKEN